MERANLFRLPGARRRSFAFDTKARGARQALSLDRRTGQNVRNDHGLADHSAANAPRIYGSNSNCITREMDRQTPGRTREALCVQYWYALCNHAANPLQ